MEKTFLVYRSSAGSGKTSALVKNYLLLCLQSEEPLYFQRINAITFTNKAANEMKERILENLHFFSTQESARSHYLYQELRKSLNCDEVIFEKRCTRLLFNILHHYSKFHVSTIDKFFYSLVRQFAEDLQLPENIRVELNQDYLLKKALEELFKRSQNEPVLAEVINDFISDKLEDGKSWNIDRDLLKFGKNLFKEKSLDSLERLKDLELKDFKPIRKGVKADASKLKKEVQEMSTQVTLVLQECGLELHDFPGKLSSGVGRYINQLNEGKIDFPTDPTQKVFKEKNFRKKNLKAAENAAFDAAEPHLEKFHQALLEKLRRITDLNYILRDLGPTFLLKILWDELEGFKNRDGIIHISEFNKKLARLVSAESVPYIYERTGEKFHHFLIDEFQDTSVVQWHNLIPLVENALSKGHRNLIVGDGKQAIYRFRNGDVMQFVKLPQLDESQSERQHIFKHSHENIFLEDNFRSKSILVEFNNKLFGSLVNGLPEAFQEIYQKHEQNIQRKEGGYISWRYLKSTQVEEIDAANFDFVKEAISECLKDGFMPGDVCLLVRRKRDARELANLLLEEGHQVETEESLAIDRSASVRLLIGLLRHLCEPKEVYHQSEILHWICKDRNQMESFIALNDSLNKKELSFDALLERFDVRLPRNELLSYGQLIRLRRLVDLFGLDDREANLLAFLDFAQSFDQQGFKTIQEFLEEFEERRSNMYIQTAADPKAFQIMTIHKAKGLEFPAVILPFCQWESQVHNEFLWIPLVREEHNLKELLFRLSLKNSTYLPYFEAAKEEAQLDNLNLLYVALTRAEERMYVMNHSGQIGDSVHSVLASDGETAIDEFISCGKYGAPEPYSSKITEQKDHLEMTSAEPGNWMEEFTFGLPEIDPFIDDWENNPRSKGSALHKVLAQLRTLEEAKELIPRLSKQFAWNEDQIMWIKGALRALSSEERLNDFFSADEEVLVERELSNSIGESIRPDRVLLKNGEVFILDFKTGKESSSELKQLETYKQVFEEMGYEKVKAEIFRFEA